MKNRRTARRKPADGGVLVAHTNRALIITLARGDVEPRAAHADFNGVVVLVFMNIRGRESKRIFVAGLFGDVGIEALEVRLLGCNKRITSGIEGKFLDIV